MLLFLFPAGAGADGSWKGVPLAEYIEALGQDLRIIYSTDLVRDDYRVLEEPESKDPELALREVLEPFGLQVTDGPSGSLLIIRLQEPVIADDPKDAPVATERLTETLPEIIVTSSRYNIRYEHAGSFSSLERNSTSRMPHLAEETLRAVDRVPGTAGGGLSAQNHVRGGRQNEQLFLFDGLRLYEPYHMKDFHSIATIVDQNVVSGIDFYSAGYQARYGDRMSGVVDATLREPPESTETEIGFSFFNTSVLSRGRFGGAGRGDWLISGRRANLDLIADVIDPDYGSPRYQDFLAHGGWEFKGHTYLSLNALLSNDKIFISEIDGSERASARYRNNVFWLKAESDWSDRLQSSTIVAATEIDNQRNGTAEKPGLVTGFVHDERDFRVLALKQDVQYSISDLWLLSAGIDMKRLEASYGYTAFLAVEPPFDTILDNEPVESRVVDLMPRGSQYAAYAELRWQPMNRLTIDAGLRWDQQTYTTASDDEQVSPRINVLYRPGAATDLRLAFGEFYQAQEINELQVSDGVTEFYPAQRARHLVASFTHDFRSGLGLRVEAYQKKYRGLMPRYENIFNPLVLIPELQIDRARIDADTAVAEGIEVSLNGGTVESLAWWGSYSWSVTEDGIDSKGTIPRSWDQTHTFKAGASRDWNDWSFSAAGIVHTGWPKTVLVAGPASALPDPAILRVGRRSSDRYGAFQSLDVRISRRFDLPKGELTAFLEVSNLYDHENPCCVEYAVQLDEEGKPFIQSKESSWLPIVPSLGVVWRF